jgi:ABC-type hemin transport system substrate-binding protein
MADVILAYEDEGQLIIIDGHMRAGLLQNETVPVVVLDVTAQEADELMTLLDPIAAMAKINKERAEQLRARVRPEIQRAMENIPAWKELRAAKKEIIEKAKDRPRFRRTAICPACGEEFDL